jgi:TRAP-type transport system periplasmic protein
VEFAEVYLALQQGVVDGQENPIPTIQAMGFHEVQDYINLTAHIQSSTQKLIAEGVWEQLSEPQQEALVEAVEEAGEEVARCIEEGDEAILDEWRETGEVEINDDIDVDAFQERAQEHFSDGFVFSDLYVQISEGD